MLKTSSAAVDLSTPVEPISFLKPIPDGCSRRGVRNPQWHTLLVAVLGSQRGSRCSRELKAFAKKHREELTQALGLNIKRWRSDGSLLFLFSKAHLQQFGDVLQAWMIGQIQGVPEGMDQLV